MSPAQLNCTKFKIKKKIKPLFEYSLHVIPAHSTSLSMATIPFDEIVPGATVRPATIDGLQYLSVRDVLMYLCDKTAKRANEKWDRLSDEVKNELAAFCGKFQFPGRGNRPELVITFKGALKLAMLVSGEKAAQHRAAMVTILSRYYAGDDSLTDEIEANAVSASPVAEMARNALAAEGALENPKKRPRVSTESFCNEISTLLKGMETEITGQLRSIAAGQEEVVVRCSQVDAKQDNIYQKLYELTNELQAERRRNESISNSLRELSAELRARQVQNERQTAAIAHLNATIRAKDALLAKAENAHESIHQKLDTLLARGRV